MRHEATYQGAADGLGAIHCTTVRLLWRMYAISEPYKENSSHKRYLESIIKNLINSAASHHCTGASLIQGVFRVKVPIEQVVLLVRV